MYTTVSVSVQEFRGIRTASSNGISSYRDFQRLPATKTNFKRVYLKGASNRVKSLKEETQFAQLCSDRMSCEKLFKFNRQDQLLNARNLHLQKLNPINSEMTLETQVESQNKSMLSSPHQNLKSSSIQFITDPKHQLIELIYNAQPVIQKQRKPLPQTQTQKTEGYQNIGRQNKSPQISKNPSFKKLIIASSKFENEIFINSTQLTTYGSLKAQTQETKTNHIPKPKIPTSLDRTKKFLKQYL